MVAYRLDIVGDAIENYATYTRAAAMSTAQTVTDRFGPEDPDEWGPGVIDIEAEKEAFDSAIERDSSTFLSE